MRPWLLQIKVFIKSMSVYGADSQDTNGRVPKQFLGGCARNMGIFLSAIGSHCSFVFICFFKSNIYVLITLEVEKFNFMRKK